MVTTPIIEIRTLPGLDLVDIVRVASGYVSDSRYDVIHTDSEDYAHRSVC